MSSSAKADDPVRRAVPIFPNVAEYWMPLRGHDGGFSSDLAYLNAEKRLSNELAGTTGAEPATTPSFADAAGAAAACESEIDGFSAGCAAACLVSVAFGAAAVAFGAVASERGGSFRLASMTFGFAGIGCALSVVPAPPPRPTLRARLVKNPSDCAVGAADATRVAGACAGAIEATSG